MKFEDTTTNLTRVKLEIVLQGYFCNRWPDIKIVINNNLLFEGPVVDRQNLTFEIDCTLHNKLEFYHLNKRFGESNIWDTNSVTGADCKLQIVDLILDQVSIGNLRARMEFVAHWSQSQLQDENTEFLNQFSVIQSSDGWMTFNGAIIFCFDTPVYDWLILNKYQINKTGLQSYFSGFSDRWNYHDDLVILNEIKQIMNLDENSNNSSPKT